MIDTGLAGRVVLVTGVTGGIGAAIARAFRAQGARLGLHHLPAETKAALEAFIRAAALDLAGVGIRSRRWLPVTYGYLRH
ncbi:hypothetical protein ACIBJE_08115 [Micromonospora sp. NPDC050187]|uniref:hypothetical protein n=1 Tax=Micromonospora sp. NPDC050187 TaxID=3364277 RepID=UPI0037ACAB13